MKKIIAIHIVLFVLAIGNVCILARNYMPIKDIAPTKCSVVSNMTATREEIVESVNKHFGIRYTLYWVENYKFMGLTNIFFRTVRLKNELNPVEVGVTLAHELCHIKYYSINETYVEFMAFRELYESDEPLLKNCANSMILSHCKYRTRKNTKYDIGYYILKYLEEKNEK